MSEAHLDEPLSLAWPEQAHFAAYPTIARGEFERILAAGRRDWLEEALRDYERKSNESLFGSLSGPLSIDELREAYSRLATSYLVCRNTRQHPVLGLGGKKSRKIVAGLLRSRDKDAIRDIWCRAARLQRLHREGYLDRELESELAQIVQLCEPLTLEWTGQDQDVLDDLTHATIEERKAVLKKMHWWKARSRDWLSYPAFRSFCAECLEQRPDRDLESGDVRIGTSEFSSAFRWFFDRTSFEYELEARVEMLHSGDPRRLRKQPVVFQWKLAKPFGSCNFCEMRDLGEERGNLSIPVHLSDRNMGSDWLGPLSINLDAKKDEVLEMVEREWRRAREKRKIARAGRHILDRAETDWPYITDWDQSLILGEKMPKNSGGRKRDLLRRFRQGRT